MELCFIRVLTSSGSYYCRSWAWRMRLWKREVRRKKYRKIYSWIKVKELDRPYTKDWSSHYKYMSTTECNMLCACVVDLCVYVLLWVHVHDVCAFFCLQCGCKFFFCVCVLQEGGYIWGTAERERLLRIKRYWGLPKLQQQKEQKKISLILSSWVSYTGIISTLSSC